MKKQTKRFFSFLLCLSMVFTLMINYVPAYAAGTVSIKFSASNLEHCRIFCKIGENERIQINAEDADGGGAIWLHDIEATEQNAVISVEPEEGFELREINVYEGENEGAGAAFNGNYDSENCTYTFPVRAMVETYLVDVNIQAKGGSGEDGPRPIVPAQSGMLSFVCQSNAVNGGDIYYKLDGADVFTKVNIVENDYDLIDVSEATTITLKLVPNDGYAVDLVRGAVLNGQRLDASGIASENGLTISLADYVRGECSVAESEFEVEFGFENNNGGQNPQDNQKSWNQEYDPYIRSGFNIVARWIGNSEGDISIDYSDDPNLEEWNTTTRKLEREDVETWLALLTSQEASDEEKSGAYDNLFGTSIIGRYVRILAGKDVGGDKFGFDIYTVDQDGNYHYNQEKSDSIKYYDYASKTWRNFDNENFRWEEYLKGNGFHDVSTGNDYYTGVGLILDLSVVDESAADAFYAHIPFDSRKNISWWNEKYRGEVEAAGDFTGHDAWVENGTVELIRVASEDGEEVYYSDEPEWNPDPSIDPSLVVELGKAGYDHGFIREGYEGPRGSYTAEQMLEAADKASGQCNVPMGSIVTVKLTPDPGYQILTAQINGMDLVPDEGTQSQFSFKINNNIHFKALFEETKDVVDVSASETVSSAIVEGTNSVVEAGNVALTVEDDDKYDTTNALKEAEGTAVATVDVAVDQIVAKAGNLTEEQQQAAREGNLEVNEDNYWATSLSELSKDITVSLTLDGVKVEAGETLSLVRDHNGKCEQIRVDVSTKDGKTVATFNSDKFSTYTFVKKSAPVHTHTLKTTTTKKATLSVNGIVETKCTVCGKVTKTTTIYYPKNFNLSASSSVYDGKEHKPTLKSVVDANGKTIAETNYTVSIVNGAKTTTVTPKAAGTYYVKIVFKGDYTGTKYVAYKINPKAGSTASLSYTSQAYTGSTLKPTVTVKDSEGKIIAANNSDGTANYTVAYLDTAGKTVTPKEVGTYTVKVSMMGNYSGTISKSYKIVPKATVIETPVIEADGITVKWTANTTGTGYYIYRSVNDASFTMVKTITSNATVSWKDTGAKTNGNKYQYKIIAYKTISGNTYQSDYSATKTSYFVSKPKISSLKNNAKSKITVKWNKNTKGTGYQLQYSTSSNFANPKNVAITKNSTVSKTIAKLKKGKTYYVRIRTYKTVGGTKYYSAWSASKKIKINK